MLDTKTRENPYAVQFDRLRREEASHGSAWVDSMRRAAIERFGALGFPTTQDEEWRYTNVAPIANTVFEPIHCDQKRSVPRPLLDEYVFDGDAGRRIVFVNGLFSPELSSLESLPRGVKVGSLADAIKSDQSLIEPHLGRYADYEAEAFTALNTAFLRDGAFVYIPRGLVVEEPIHLVYLTAGDGAPLVTHPRNLILADADSQATIVETHGGAGEGVYFTNTVTELVARENAVVDHYKVERETERAYYISRLQIHQSRSSTVSSHAITLGGAIVRNDIYTVLDGEGCDCTLNGLYMLHGTQHVDNHLRVEHAKPHGDSRQFFKSVLDDQSHGVFTGRIIVRQDAQKTDGKQTNMNLILSDQALADSKPQLEIFADDVKCTHGATIGQVDREAIFYLRTRGLSEAAARSVLVFAFAGESIERIRVPGLCEKLKRYVFARLPQSGALREAV